MGISRRAPTTNPLEGSATKILKRSATKSLEGGAAQPLAGEVLQTPLRQVALELERPAVPLHLVPQPQVLAEPLLLQPHLLADALLLLLQLAVVRLEFFGQARREGAEGWLGLAAGDDGGHCVQEVLGKRRSRGWRGGGRAGGGVEWFAVGR